MVLTGMSLTGMSLTGSTRLPLAKQLLDIGLQINKYFLTDDYTLMTSPTH